jgi:phenylacetaldehyde dehydrogenase
MQVRWTAPASQDLQRITRRIRRDNPTAARQVAKTLYDGAMSHERVKGFLEAGRKEGAEVVTGGNVVGNQGYFVEPTVLARTDRNMKVVREEIFGPVVCVQSFDDADLDAVAKFANDTEYGLSSSVWTRNLKAAHMMARKIRAGTVCINTHNYGDPAWPFGGYKQSGWDREMGKEVMEYYTETKAVAARL